VFAGDEPVNALQTAGKPRPALESTQSLAVLVEEIAKTKGCSQIHISRPGLSLRLERRRSA
jgi:hypothetical protein